MSNTQQSYTLHIGSVIWTLDWEDSPNLYVTADVEGSTRRSMAIDRRTGRGLDCNEKFILIGHTSSVISLALKLSTSLFGEDALGSIASLSIGTLLTRCANGKFSTFEISSSHGKLDKSIGQIAVKLSRLIDGEVVVGEDLARDLSKLAGSQLTRFERFGKLSDIDDCILNVQTAVRSTSDEHPNKAEYLHSLGFSYRLRYDRLEGLADIEHSILNLRKAVQLTDDRHPNKPIYLSGLGVSQLRRYGHLGGLKDIEDSISNHQWALQLTNDGDPNKAAYFSNLGLSQQDRFHDFGEVTAVEDSISSFHRALQCAHFGDPSISTYFCNLGLSRLWRYNCLGRLNDIEDSILNLQMALQLTEEDHPERPTRLSHVGLIQLVRYLRLGGLDDIEESISNQQRALQLTEDGDPSISSTLDRLGLSQQVRFNRLSELADIENSISNHRKAVQLSVDGHPAKVIRLSNLGLSQRARFKHIGELTDIEDCISNLDRAVQSTNDKNPNKATYLSNLGLSQRDRFDRLGELTDIQDCISNLYIAVQLTDDRHPNKAKFLSHLGVSQLRRYDRLGGLNDIEDSISNQQKAIRLTEDGDPSEAIRLFHLGLSQQARFDRLGKLTDLEASISSFKTAAQSKTSYPHDALQAARNWADLSHHHNNVSSALDGYRTALEILPKVAWLGLSTASLQNSLSREDSDHLSCLAATCAIQQGHLEEAVELLDMGRSVFWQQASSLRADLEKLKETEPTLALQLEMIGQKLDASTFSGSLLRVEEQNVGASTAEEVGKERRRLFGEWESLLERVRQLSHFENFLKPVPFRQLRQAAVGGHIIIINISRYGVDALIFDAAHQIEHVPLPNTDLQTLSKLAGDILFNQPVNASAAQRGSHTTRYLRPALRNVWDDIMVPIFDKIQVHANGNSSPPRRRIWWYPTGPLTFIPIHASGPGKGGIDVSRFIISSYVTTLSSHFHVQKNMTQCVKERPKLLAVSQPETPGQQRLPLSTEEVNTVVQMASSAGWPADDIVHLNGSDATVGRVSDALNYTSWVHFACHGMQHVTSGMHSAFALHDGYLELSQIASKRLSNAQFAFLSACNTATGIEKLPGEAMHLAGALQFAGFLSVIATMWGVDDTDTAIVASHVYQHLFHNRLQGCDSLEVATALNRAISLLREHEGVTVDRWAPFIHFGF